MLFHRLLERVQSLLQIHFAAIDQHMHRTRAVVCQVSHSLARACSCLPVEATLVEVKQQLDLAARLSICALCTRCACPPIGWIAQ